MSETPYHSCCTCHCALSSVVAIAGATATAIAHVVLVVRLKTIHTYIMAFSFVATVRLHANLGAPLVASINTTMTIPTAQGLGKIWDPGCRLQSALSSSLQLRAAVAIQLVQDLIL